MTPRVRMSDFHDAIVAGRLAGKPDAEIAAEIGRPRSSVAGYRGRAGITKIGIPLQLPVGQINILGSLSEAELLHVNARAVACGCDTLSEYVLETVLDALAEEMGAAE